MYHLTRFRAVVLLLFAFGLAAAWPSAAEAQRRRTGRVPAVRSVVVVGAVGYPGYRFDDPWFRYGYPWSPWAPYGLGYYPPEELTSSIRIDVEPRDAEVYVDGYLAGHVDHFDGIFQRLRLRPGHHEIVVYRDGYRTVRHALYFNPGSDQKVTYHLEPLASGEMAAPPAPPSELLPAEIDDPPMSAEPTEPGRQAGPAPSARFGTLAIRVQPSDADIFIFIDGERWQAPVGQEQIAIRLAEGRHRVEVRSAGFSQYVEDVLIRSGGTLSLNVSLLRGDTPGGPVTP